MPRRFTLHEAEHMLPELDPEIRQASKIKHEFDEAEAVLRSVSQHITSSGGALVDRERLIRVRSRREALAARLKEVIEGIEEYGCVVKDLDTGLLDFPTFYRGQEVCLCWKVGEKRIEFWHGAEEGFRGRKPIDQDFVDNHRGDPPN